MAQSDQQQTLTQQTPSLDLPAIDQQLHVVQQPPQEVHLQLIQGAAEVENAKTITTPVPEQVDDPILVVNTATGHGGGADEAKISCTTPPQAAAATTDHETLSQTNKAIETLLPQADVVDNSTNPSSSSSSESSSQVGNRPISVLVHCSEGRSRSPTLIIAYLIRFQQWTLEVTFLDLSYVTMIHTLPHIPLALPVHIT